MTLVDWMDQTQLQQLLDEHGQPVLDENGQARRESVRYQRPRVFSATVFTRSLGTSSVASSFRISTTNNRT